MYVRNILVIPDSVIYLVADTFVHDRSIHNVDDEKIGKFANKLGAMNGNKKEINSLRKNKNFQLNVMNLWKDNKFQKYGKKQYMMRLIKIINIIIKIK